MTDQHVADRIDVARLRASEVDRLETAIGGLRVEYVRTGGGQRPCEVTVASTSETTLSLGKVGFSVIANAETPNDRIVFALITAAPHEAKWNGVELKRGDVYAYAPQTTFFGVEPAGSSAAILVVPTNSAQQVAFDLRIGDPAVGRAVAPLPSSPLVKRLATGLWRSYESPGLLRDSQVLNGVLEDAVRVVASSNGSSPKGVRRIDSRRIVQDCIDVVADAGWQQPPMSVLCKSAFASESRVRKAFLDVVGVPPTRYFQMQLLSRVRNALMEAPAETTTVTEVAMSLGVTRLGRFSGRYRSLFGELPSQTLRRG